MLRGFFIECTQKHLTALIYFLRCAETFCVVLIYLLSAPRNIRCADLFYMCAETFVIVCEGDKPASRDYLIDPTRHDETLCRIRRQLFGLHPRSRQRLVHIRES